MDIRFIVFRRENCDILQRETKLDGQMMQRFYCSQQCKLILTCLVVKIFYFFEDSGMTVGVPMGTSSSIIFELQGILMSKNCVFDVLLGVSNSLIVDIFDTTGFLIIRFGRFTLMFVSSRSSPSDRSLSEDI